MTGPTRHVKIMEWSDGDGAFVGRCPGVIGPCCHGPDEIKVYRDVCEIVVEWVQIAGQVGAPVSPAKLTFGHRYNGGGAP